MGSMFLCPIPLSSDLHTAAVEWADVLVIFAFFSMQTYLSDVWKLSFTHAAAILNIWGGISKILPVFFLFLADALMGHFKIIVIASIACSVGIVLVTMSTPPVLANSTGTCKEYDARCIGHTQKVLFYTGMALLALGIGGHRASLEPFLVEQHDGVRTFYQLSGRCGPCLILRTVTSVSVPFVLLVLFFVFPYIKQWILLFGVPGMCVVSATLIFLSGWFTYTYKYFEPQGSPLSDVFRVFVAAALKISQPFQADTSQLYKKDDEGNNSFPPHRFPRYILMWLEKAAIILPEDEVRNTRSWTLCSVQQVECAKCVVRVLPIGATFIICTIVSSVGNTFFVEQGSHMNRNLGKWKVPSQLLLAIFYLGKRYFGRLADRLLRKFRPVQGIAVAMMFSVLCCVTASGIEIKRLKGARQHGLVDGPDKVVPMSAYWLFFPFVLLAGLDSFLGKSVEAFYKMESPKVMAGYCKCFGDAVSGLGLMYSVLSVYVVGKMSEIGGRQSWFEDNLNKSRLDLYYWTLAALGALNLLIFIPMASLYKDPTQGTNQEQPAAGED